MEGVIKIYFPSAVAVVVDIQNTLVNSLITRLGTKAQKEKYLTKLATESVSLLNHLLQVTDDFVRLPALLFLNPHQDLMLLQ